MERYLDKLFILEGIILGIIGLLFFMNPMGSLLSLTTIVGVLIIISGISRLIRGWNLENKVLAIVISVLDVILGLILILYPISTVENLVLFYGVWALVRGILGIIMSIKYKNFGFNVNTIYNVISIVFGILISTNPFVLLIATIYLPYMIGIYFVIAAISEIYIGFKIR